MSDAIEICGREIVVRNEWVCATDGNLRVCDVVAGPVRTGKLISVDQFDWPCSIGQCGRPELVDEGLQQVLG